MQKIRVLIVDDDAIIREGLAALLGTHQDIEVVGVAVNGKEAIDFLGKKSADILLLDIDMPVLDGISTAKIVELKFPQISIVMLTAFARDDYLMKSLTASIKGFLTKDIPSSQLADVLRQINAGFSVLSSRPNQVLSQNVSKKLIDDEKQQTFRRDVDELPDYLKAVFMLLIQAKPNKTIARELNLSESTVRIYVSEIFGHMGFNNRGELTIAALRAGY